jgi:hypothetical protein
VQQLHADIAAAVARFEKNIFGEKTELPMLKPGKKKSYSAVSEIESMLPTLTKGHVNGAGSAKSQGELGKGPRKCLIAIAQNDSVTKSQLTQLTSYKRSTRDAYLAVLRAAHYIIMSGGSIQATRDGLTWLGSDYEKLPTGDALLRYWLRNLPLGEQRVLELITRAATEWDREDIGAHLDYSRSTRDAYLHKLIARKLVVVTRGGCVQASSMLFDR